MVHYVIHKNNISEQDKAELREVERHQEEVRARREELRERKRQEAERREEERKRQEEEKAADILMREQIEMLLEIQRQQSEMIAALLKKSDTVADVSAANQMHTAIYN